MDWDENNEKNGKDHINRLSPGGNLIKILVRFLIRFLLRSYLTS